MYILRNLFFQYGANTKLNIGHPNAIVIKNTGDVKAFVNDFPLASGEVFTSNLLDPTMVDETAYQITFDPAGDGNKLVNVIASFVSPMTPAQQQQIASNGASC